MKKNNKIKIIILCFITILAPFYTCTFNSNYLDNNNEENEYSLEKLKRSDYSSFSEGIGENINVSLQQSLLDDSPIIISNISDSNNNKFYEPSPTVENFNSSFVDITIEDIYAPNKTVIVEDDTSLNWHDLVNTYVSFELEGAGYIENISLFIVHQGVSFNLLDIYLFTAENDSNEISPLDSSWKLIVDDFNITNTAKWWTITNIHEKYNVSETYNKTYFLYTQYSGANLCTWSYILDQEGLDGEDNSIVLDSGENPIQYWGISQFNTIDLSLKVDVAPYIYPSDKTLIVEDYEANSEIIDKVDSHYISFRPKSNGIISNISIRLRRESSDITNYTIYLYNATQSVLSAIPDSYYPPRLVFNEPITSAVNTWIWWNFTNINRGIDCSQTYNNTFFLRLQPTDLGFIDCDGAFDWGFQDFKDESIVLDYQYNPVEVIGITVDVCLKVGLNSHKNIPNPEDIGLMINNSAVIGYNAYGSGSWSSMEEYSSSSGQLEFEISADWWDVSCTISRVQINYTKTNLKANSMFRVLGSGQDVLWNVSRTDGLNFFDTRLSNYRINFTIPSAWNNINVFNGGMNKTGDISISSSKNGYKTIQVVNAGNGTYWHLTAISENLLTSIDTYVNSVATEIVRYSDIVDFNATFKEIIAQNDGIINLSVYNPSAIDNELIFASFNSTFVSDIEFYLGGWDISDNITNYGEFRVQISWNNNTAAGFSEKILTIIGETDLTLITPTQDAIYYSNQSFNIIVHYKDSNQLNAIDGASIQYNINGQGWQSTSFNNGTIGYYIIPVDCSVFTIDGTKTVEIIAGKNYYESQTLDYNFNVSIVEENGKQEEEFPLVIIITIVSTAGGIGIAVVIIILLRKRKRANTVT